MLIEPVPLPCEGRSGGVWPSLWNMGSRRVRSRTTKRLNRNSSEPSDTLTTRKNTCRPSDNQLEPIRNMARSNNSIPKKQQNSPKKPTRTAIRRSRSRFYSPTLSYNHTQTSSRLGGSIGLPSTSLRGRLLNDQVHGTCHTRNDPTG